MVLLDDILINFKVIFDSGYLFGKLLSLIFIPLQEKSEQKFTEIFFYLKDYANLNPNVVVTNYKMAFFFFKDFSSQTISYKNHFTRNSGFGEKYSLYLATLYKISVYVKRIF
ncbi:hypothetical protein DMUE_3143 [Dictyocoela muelleri]|nr:hypothetical protein DMUE_3143 [Dictyocoela muelleri]